jgi:hypothetical protein
MPIKDIYQHKGMRWVNRLKAAANGVLTQKWMFNEGLMVTLMFN